ncbi:PREDICTED: ankyrin repeat, PH and SEC7 domain containing protein secG [Theobroma cacao]|uniref:Ankyrin repeat, PH and SEC7 domain containing protein secG n=1 Tax=Theobroma cacao TaxID=3641 RepID=A0AB32WTH6_THECC|nr:PREDICTED: ankyrin repeat, PH and SEC7 domain containing protein secG [Theobroma cacao]
MITGWRGAALAGNIEALYASIQEDGDVLKRIDEVEFVDTPLHIAAAAGHTDFVMEMMNLKPSFAKKLNQRGFSSLHLALQNGHKETVLRLLEINKDLVRVKGKEGYTPLHYVTGEGNLDLLAKFLEDCPECIFDVTIHNQTAFHIAVENNRLAALRVLSKMLKKTDCCQDVVNRKDKDGHTALHRAAAKNYPQMLKLLLACKADKNVTNQAGLTALDVARGQVNNRESINILGVCSFAGVSTLYKLWQLIVKFLAKASIEIFRDMDSISSEDRNASLVILGLLLTATYQAILSPPGGVWQGQVSETRLSPPSGAPTSTPTPTHSKKSRNMVGTSIMDPGEFLVFYLTICAVFIVAFFLTLGLLKPFPRGFKTALQVLLAFFAICFQTSIYTITPFYFYVPLVIDIFLFLVFVIMMSMSTTSRVSKISVTVLGCWLLWGVIFQSFASFIY